MGDRDDDQCEASALELLKLAELDSVDGDVDPIVVAHQAAVALSPRVPSRCRGALDVEGWKARYDGRGTEQSALANLTHELGHLAQLIAGVKVPHCEASTDRVAMALRLSRSTVRRAVREDGLNPQRLIDRWPKALPAWVLLRVAWVLRLSAIVVIDGDRWASAPDGRGMGRPGGWEKEFKRVVRATGEPHVDLLGSRGWPIRSATDEGVLILLGDPDETTAEQCRGENDAPLIFLKAVNHR